MGPGPCDRTSAGSHRAIRAGFRDASPIDMTNIDTHQQLSRYAANLIAGAVAEHRQQAHQTSSVPEKIRHIRAMAQLRSVRSSLIALEPAE